MYDRNEGKMSTPLGPRLSNTLNGISIVIINGLNSLCEYRYNNPLGEFHVTS